MFRNIIRVLGGDPSKKTLDRFNVIVEEINKFEDSFESLSLEELQGKTDAFRRRLLGGETLDDLLPEAFATVREASKRTIGLRHYDVQLIGGICLHEGIVAEMRTGEGKTLVATLPIYLNSLELNPLWIDKAERKWGADFEAWKFESIDDIQVSQGVHLVTVNDYLARRDARWKAPIYSLLGLSVGVLQMAARTEHGKKAFLIDLEKESPHEDQHQLQMVLRQKAYAADITYGTNNEFGFDYLRDNMAMSLEDRVQRGHFYAIIDEVDNVLIDEARTPLIISGPSHDDTEWYTRMSQLVRRLNDEDYELNIKDRTVTLTEVGETHVESLLGIALRDPDRPEDITPEQARLMGYLEQSLRAQFLYKRNKEYLVQVGKVVIVDEFTGRLMPGRRWSDGLHQAVEAKEGVRIQSENVTYATITIQNYFRMYNKLAGMTGTAITESEEFDKIYSLETLAIPTNLEFQANRPDPTLVSHEAVDEHRYTYTYYSRIDDPEQNEEFYKRKDYPDVIYRSEEAKLRAITKEIIQFHVFGRPILVGTTSVELSDRLSNRLRAEPVRRLLQTLIIRDVYFETSGKEEDGRIIDVLQPLNTSLLQLKPAQMRTLIKENELEISLNPEAPENIDRLVSIFNIPADSIDRLQAVIKAGIPHQVLNARKHTEESQIIADAGSLGAVTIATNMAGRGVDIRLGGELTEDIINQVRLLLRRQDIAEQLEKTDLPNIDELSIGHWPEAIALVSEEDRRSRAEAVGKFLDYIESEEKVKQLGGLHVIGSERHEARRIDNQLRGRAARQGDPGSSRFYLSLEDDLMIRFGGQQLETMLSRFRVDEALPIEHTLVSRIVEQSQTRVEGANFDIRKHLLEYDDVLNTQRAKVYSQRDLIFTKEDLSDDVAEMLQEEVNRRVPEALALEEGPWKLIGWMEQILPSIIVSNTVFPSYTIKLILDSILSESPILTKTDASEKLKSIVHFTLTAEHEHIKQSYINILDLSQERMEFQLAERYDALDTFIDGIQHGEAKEFHNTADLEQELISILQLPIKITPSNLQTLTADPDKFEDELRTDIEKIIKSIFVKRLIGAVERIQKAALNIDPQPLETASWDEINIAIEDSLDANMNQRISRYVGNGSPGTISQDIEEYLSQMQKDSVNTSDLIRILTLLPQGKKAGFDKKTHRRVWQKTTRLSHTYLGAKLLIGKDIETVTEDALTHLQKAQQFIQQVWGAAELSNIARERLIDLDESIRENLLNILDEDTFNSHKNTIIQELSKDILVALQTTLGRIALTRVYRELMLRVISELWVEYLTQMEALRVSIGLEAYAQRDPLVQYKNKAFEMFQNLLEDMRMSIVTRMFTFQPRKVEQSSNAQTKEERSIEGNLVEPSVKEKKKKKRRRRR